MELLRFATAGSVDDGKSTLIGRLLYDSKAIFEDQLEAVERVSVQRGNDYTDLALLTDGLRAEREQGITIDVAYRYFATPGPQVHHRRHPRARAVHPEHGHRELDRRPDHGAGRRPQGHRRADPPPRLPGIAPAGAAPVWCASTRWTWSTTTRGSSTRICAEFTAFASRLDVTDLTFIPISALQGDNVVTRSANMAWYEGTSLLHHLETVYIASDRNLIDPRMPVQWVIRPHAAEYHDYRGYAGRIDGGVFRPGRRGHGPAVGARPRRSPASTPSRDRSRRRSPRCR